jgi:hypothetical protein
MDDRREPPYEAYAAIVGAFFAGLGTVAVLARRAPPATALDLAALSAATFKASRTLSRERLGRFRPGSRRCARRRTSSKTRAS